MPRQDDHGTDSFSSHRLLIMSGISDLKEGHERILADVTDLRIQVAVQQTKIMFFSGIAATIATVIANGTWKLLFGGKAG